MKLLAAIIGSVFLLAVAAFCVFGFMACVCPKTYLVLQKQGWLGDQSRGR